MIEPAGGGCGEGGGCVTCGDRGAAVRVLELSAGAARCVDEQGAVHVVAVDLIGEVRPGEVLLAHAGVALTRLEGVLGAPGRAGLDARWG
jgi:hypothetical protein